MRKRPWALFAVLVHLLALFLPSVAEAGPLVPLTWEWRNPAPQGNTLRAVTYGNGQFVAVGDGGTILTSPDGAQWTPRPTARLMEPLEGIVFADGRFVAYSDWSLLTSGDGTDWQVQPSPLKINRMTGLTYGNGQFTAISSNEIAVSPDGLTWKPHPFHPPDSAEAVAFGNGRLVLLMYRGLLSTADGIIWDSPRDPVDQQLQTVQFAGDRFFLTGRGSAALHSSADGMTWVRHAPDAPPDTRESLLSAVAYGTGRYVAVGWLGQVHSSPDGRAWTREESGTRADLLSVAYGEGQFVAVGADGAILTSPDGRTWTARHAGPTPMLNSVAYGNSRFVAVGQGGALLTSDDGLRWVQGNTGTTVNLGTVRFLNGQFIAVGAGGTLLTSPDGISWTRQDAGTRADLGDVAWGAGQYIAVGSGGILRSADGVQWKPVLTDEKWSFTAVAYGSGRFVATGPSFATSGDGLTWRSPEDGGSRISRITYGPAGFAGLTSELLTSTEGFVWKPNGQLNGGHMYDVTAARGWYVVVGLGRIFTSTDGRRWAPNPVPVYREQRLNGVTYGAGRFVVVGEKGTVLVSSPVGDAPVCGQRFADVPGSHPACDVIEDLAAQQMVNGYADGTFRPEQTITRAEFAKMLTTMLGWPAYPTGRLPFTDTKEHWSAKQGVLQAVYLRQAINGFPDNTFRPDEPVTRAQLVTIAVSAGGLFWSSTAPYKDVSAGHWYAKKVGTAHWDRLIGPYATWPLWAGDTFEGDRPATRAEAATIVTNLAARLRR